MRSRPRRSSAMLLAAGILAFPATSGAADGPAKSSRIAFVMAIPFLAAGGTYATRPSFAAPGWAIPELVHGSVYVSVAVAHATDDMPGWDGSAWVWGTLGVALLGHGVLSLALYHLPGTRQAAGAPRVSLLPGPGTLGVHAVF